MPDSPGYYLVDISLLAELPLELLEKQRAFLSGLTAQGVLLMAAVVPAIKGRGLAIVQANSEQEVRQVYLRAPIVEAGAASIDVNLVRLTAGLVLDSLV